MMEQPDVLIIGGGVIGLTSAYYLARDGVRVTVVDRGELGRAASWAGAGIIPPGNPDRALGSLDLLRAASSHMFPSLTQQLLDFTGISNGYRVCGGVELATGIDETILQAWRNEGIRFESMAGRDLRRIEPAFAKSIDAVYFLPDMAQVRNPWHLRALIDACQRLGVTLRPNCPVVRLLPERAGRVVGVETSREILSANRFLVAAGAWTDRLLEPLGRRVGVTPIRGQIVLFRPEQPVFGTILLDGLRYLVPRADGRVLAGSTEEDAGYVNRTTDAGIAELTAFARHLVPSLNRAPIETTWAGLRPSPADGLPTLGRHPDFHNLYIAAGHFRAGIQLSPATGLCMSQLLQDRPSAIPLDAFRPDRPVAPAPNSAFHS